jgi:hypothetical protein
MINGFIVLVLLSPVITFAGECPRNPMNNFECNSQNFYLDQSGKLRPAGICNQNTLSCICSTDFKGKACEIPVFADARGLLVNEWGYLAKSCWAPQSEGLLSVSLHIQLCPPVSGECNLLSTTKISHPMKLLFYSSYTDDFNQVDVKSIISFSRFECLSVFRT